MKTIELLHWTKGGTGVTNFSEDIEVYEEAVREFNDSRLLIYPLPCQPGRNGAKSLHWVGSHKPDLSGFWELFRTIQADRQFEAQFCNAQGKCEQRPWRPTPSAEPAHTPQHNPQP